MANPRYVLDNDEPSVELLEKLNLARQVYFNNLDWFCDKWAYNKNEMSFIKSVWLIGSHTTDTDWRDETSDLDLKLVVPAGMSENLYRYKREVLDPLLCIGEKKRWIDMFFARREDQVMPPRVDLTAAWEKLVE